MPDSADTAPVEGAITSGRSVALSPADHLAADELEDPGGMTWREVKDFLDHMRETCIEDRQKLKLEVRRLRAILLEMVEHGQTTVSLKRIKAALDR